MKALDPNLPLFQIRTLSQQKSDSLFLQRMLASLLGGFGVLGALLASLGIYGVLACHVGQRTREIGVRMALGADPSRVLRLVVWQGMRVALVGIFLGLFLAMPLTRGMRTLLFQVTPADPLTFIAIPILLSLAALAACWVPARRAARVDPMLTLRTE